MLMALVIPAINIAPSYAAAEVTIDPASGTARVRSGRMAANIAAATVITVTGTGLPADQDNIKLRILGVASTAAAGQGTQLTTTAGAGDLTDATLFGSDSNTLKADATGYFKAKIRVPDGYQEGSYNIYAEFAESGKATTISSTSTLTIDAAVAVVNTYSKATSGINQQPVEVLVSGFKAGETISITPTNFLTTAVYGASAFSSFALVAAKTGTYGTTTTTNVGYLGSRAGGSFTVTVSGESSGIDASTTFTINPSIAVLTSLDHNSFTNTVDTTRLSISASASVMWLTGRNFAASKTVESASTATLTSGSTTQTLTHSAVKTNAAGDFGPLKFTYTTGLTLGEVTIAIDSTDYNLAGKNIIPPGTAANVSSDIMGALRDYGDLGGGIGTTTSRKLGVAIAGPIIASKTGGPPIMTLDGSSYSVGDEVLVLGSGMSATVTATHTYAPQGGTAANPTMGPNTVTTDSLGAYFAFVAGDKATVQSTNLYGIPQSRLTTASEVGNVLSVAMSGGSTPDSITVAITPKVTTLTAHLSYREDPALILTGFKAQALSVTVGGTSWVELASSDVGATGTVSLTAIGAALPNIAGQASAATFEASGTTSGNSATKAITVYTEVDPVDDSTSALTPTSGEAEDEISILTASTYGVHGLKASTEYEVYLGLNTGTKVATFTSTATGTLPAGVTFSVPDTAVTGVQLVDIRETDGTSAIWDKIEESAQSQYTNLQLTITGKVTADPSVVNVGDSTAVTFKGLKAATDYVVTISTSSSSPEAVSRASFTSTSTGAGDASFDFPTKKTDGANGEQGTTYYVFAQTDSQFGGSSYDARGSVVLQSALALDKTSGTAGEQIAYTLKGGQTGSVYKVIFDYKQGSTTTTYTGKTVGTAATDTSLGKATGTITVPSDASVGSHTVNVVVVSGSDTTAGTAILSTDIDFTVKATVAAPTITGAALSPAAPKVDGAITVTATVNAASSATISSVTLYHKGVGATSFTSVVMTADGSTYSGAIPAQTAEGTLEYYIAAVDSSDNTTYEPATAPTTGSTVTIAAKAVVTGTNTATVTLAATQTTAGASATSFATGATVAFSATLKNNAGDAKDFLVIVQVKDSAGAVVAITYSNLNNVAADSSDSYSLSPVITGSGLIASAGTYNFEIFVFDNLADQTALSLTTDAVSFTLT
jgi:hypothetical protein